MHDVGAFEVQPRLAWRRSEHGQDAYQGRLLDMEQPDLRAVKAQVACGPADKHGDVRITPGVVASPMYDSRGV